MNSKLQWKSVALGSAAALMLVMGTAATYPQVVSQAADSTTTPAPTQQPQRGDRGADVNRGDRGNDVDRNAQLAEALGITTDELQTAYVKAATAAIDKAVADGSLTETQAQTLRDRLTATDSTGRGFDLGHFGGRGASTGADFKALLADALGITTDALDAAETKAQATALAQQVTDGNLTQEEADLIAARDAFRKYEIAQQPAFAEEVAAAVEAGAITQAQADLLLANQQDGAKGFGFDLGGPDQGGERGGRGGHGGPEGRGGQGDAPFGQNGEQGVPNFDGSNSQGTQQVPNFGSNG